MRLIGSHDAVYVLRLAIMYLMAYACLYVRKNNEKRVQHETIGYLRELVKRGGIIREREKLWPREDR